MVSSSNNSTSSVESTSAKYRGVRKRNWGKWVAEIRLPNSRERIWLGSYDSAEKAARAFDAALFCLRGPTAKFNLPNCPPDIPGGMSFSHSQIQSAAAEFANQSVSYNSPSCSESQQTTTPFDELDCSSDSVSDSMMFSDMFVSRPDPDVSGSGYGCFDEFGFGDYCYEDAAFEIEEQQQQQQQQQQEVINYIYDAEDYIRLWNF